MFECPPWALTHVVSCLQKLGTDLQIVSSSRSLQIVCSAVSGPLRSVVLVLAPRTSSTWLPARGSRGGTGLGCLLARGPCKWRLGSACQAIRFVLLQNSLLKVKFPSVWHTSSKYSFSMKEHICAKLCAKQMNIWCKNIHAFLRCSSFRAGTFDFTLFCELYWRL